MKTTRISACLLFAFLVALLLAPLARAQERVVQLSPTGVIDEPKTFLPANGIHVTLPAATFTATATGTSNVFTVPFGQLGDPTYPGGLPTKPTAVVLHFYVTSVQVEYVTLTGATAAAVVNVGSTGTAANALVTAASLPYTGVTPGSIVPAQIVATGTNKPLASGDVITFNVGTAFAGATAASFKVHVAGYYQ